MKRFTAELQYPGYSGAPRIVRTEKPLTFVKLLGWLGERFGQITVTTGGANLPLSCLMWTLEGSLKGSAQSCQTANEDNTIRLRVDRVATHRS